MSAAADIIREEILDPAGIEEGVLHLCDQLEPVCKVGGFAFVGIFTRGITLAQRVADRLGQRGIECPIGTLDISLYRDDFGQGGQEFPTLESSEIPFPIDDSRVILFDEVIFTGRTIRAALDGIMDYGRPSKVELAVLVDRGHREFPIQPDYVGKKVETGADDYVKVRFQENDGKEGVFLVTKQ